MKAMVLGTSGPVAGNPLELRDVPVPDVGPEDILVRVRVCGVCHTDLHAVEGELPETKLPLIPGHEVIGVVERVGEGSAFRSGRTRRHGLAALDLRDVPVLPERPENLCESARFNGYHADGGYAEFMAVPENAAYAVPDRFTDEEAAPLMCAGIIGYRALAMSGFVRGGVVGLYGFGASAHIALQIAQHRDARVFVFTRSEEHRKLALELGAEWAGAAKDEPPAKLTNAVIFAPVGALYLDALRVLDRGGTVASAGIHMSPVPEVDYDRLLYHERRMVSVANATRADGEELSRAAAEIPVRTTVQTFPLEAANDVLKLLKAGKITGAAVLKMGDM